MCAGHPGVERQHFCGWRSHRCSPAGKFAGNIYYKNKPLQEFDEQISAFRIGYVQQNPDNQIVTDTVWHELAFGLENAGIAGTDDPPAGE